MVYRAELLALLWLLTCEASSLTEVIKKFNCKGLWKLRWTIMGACLELDPRGVNKLKLKRDEARKYALGLSCQEFIFVNPMQHVGQRSKWKLNSYGRKNILQNYDFLDQIYFSFLGILLICISSLCYSSPSGIHEVAKVN